MGATDRRRVLAAGGAFAFVGAAGYATGSAGSGDSISPHAVPGVITPEQFGARGDGETDDAQALQDMLDAASAAGGATCLLGAKTYVFASPLRVQPRSTSIVGSGLGAMNSRSSEIVGGGTVLKSKVNGGSAVTFGAADESPGVTNGFRLRDVFFCGSGEEDVLVEINFARDGIVEGCLFGWSGGTGVRLGRPQNLTFIGNVARNNRAWGVHVSSYETGSGTGNGQTCRVVSNTFTTNGAGGLWLGGGAEHVVAFNQIESHTEPDGIAVLLQSFRHLVMGNVFENNVINVQWGTADTPSRDTSVVHNQMMGGDLRFVNYGRERFQDNHVEDYGSKRPWGVRFSGRSSGSTRWTGNAEHPARPVQEAGQPSAQGELGSGWNQPHLVMGEFHLWVDARGQLRMKRGAPTRHDDGTPVGS